MFNFFYQFLHTGNDHAARETCPCIWIINPRETGKVLQHVLKYLEITPVTLSTLSLQPGDETGSSKSAAATPVKIDIYTGETK